MVFKRVFLFVLDSFGIGNAPDAADFGDTGSNTLLSCSASPFFHLPNLQAHGLFNIDGVALSPAGQPSSAFGRLTEASKGKDTTIGHWEIAGLISEKPLPTYPNGFPREILDKFEAATGRKTICNKPYSGTAVIRDYGAEQEKSGAFIVYTSADSVFQIAANKAVIPLEELYAACEKAREILCGEHALGRVIARPFIKENGVYVRTSERRDYSLAPPQATLPEALKNAGFDSISIGKIYDIFAHKGFTEHILTHSNEEGMKAAEQVLQKDFCGLCFLNLVDFDMLYGHRNDVDGYAAALSRFDAWLPSFTERMRPEDVLFITADHGCDPATPSTDHSREQVPLIVIGNQVKTQNLGTEPSYAVIAKTVAENFGVANHFASYSILNKLVKE